MGFINDWREAIINRLVDWSLPEEYVERRKVMSHRRNYRAGIQKKQLKTKQGRRFFANSSRQRQSSY